MAYASPPRFLPYRPIVAVMLGRNAAIVLAEVEYWEKYKIGNDMVFKSIPDFFLESGLSRSEQDAGISKLLKAELIYYKLGRSNIRHFRTRREDLKKFIHSAQNNHTLLCQIAARKCGRKPHTITLKSPSTTPSSNKTYPHQPRAPNSNRGIGNGVASHISASFPSRFKKNMPI